MSSFFVHVKELVAQNRFRVSVHGFDNLEDRDISLYALVESIAASVVVEEYPDFHKGPSILLRHEVSPNKFVHALWGASKLNPGEATLVTAYHPEPRRWSKDFLQRLPK